MNNYLKTLISPEVEKNISKFGGSIVPSVAGVLSSHWLLTIKVNQQVIGGKPLHLYSGISWYLAKSVPGNTLAFLFLQNDSIKEMSPFMQGAVSKLAAEAIVYPFGLWSAMRQVGRVPKGYFKGLPQTLVRDFVFSGAFVQVHRGYLADSDLPLPIRLAAASTVASLVTQPLDWYKVRSQLSMSMNGLFSGMVTRLVYCNVRSIVAWSIYEKMLR